MKFLALSVMIPPSHLFCKP
uniref:Uncharacterized protein n=1 Tax=Lepeophtheirus salmonis TaxID=72036 RepID=A0A0K2SYJ1_LEPSM